MVQVLKPTPECSHPWVAFLISKDSVFIFYVYTWVESGRAVRVRCLAQEDNTKDTIRQGSQLDL